MVSKNQQKMPVAYASYYAHKLPEGHRFPMIKYELLPLQLIREGTMNEDEFFEPELLTSEKILLTHQPDYLNALKTLQLNPAQVRKIGFPLCEKLVKREIGIISGTWQNALFAMQTKVSFNIAGGTHHAYANSGEGFCLLNDIAVAANLLINNKLVNKILIVDLDVHQGNGTAKIFENHASIFLDIALPDGCDDATYLAQLDYHLKYLIDTLQPEFIFFQAGVDVLKSDKLGRLDLTIEGCKQRDELVLKACFENKIPVAVSMGGGYSPNIRDILEAHANTFRVAKSIFF
jgi:acetoin utilization deacetylase AcuC-like enzyme